MENEFKKAAILLLVLQVFLSFLVVNQLGDWDERLGERQLEERDHHLTRPCYDCCYYAYGMQEHTASEEERSEEEHTGEDEHDDDEQSHDE